MRTLVALCLAFGILTGNATDTAQSAPGPPATPATDPWSPVRVLQGEWSGTAEGEPGKGAVQRTYEFVLGNRFLHERNVSSYEPRTAGTPGEIHHHWSFISFDKQRQRLVLRQFHQEGFVNQYVLVAEASTASRLVFESEAFENLDGRWRARETYEIASPDTFVEIFELAEPGKDWSVYSKNTFRRAAAP